MRMREDNGLQTTDNGKSKYKRVKIKDTLRDVISEE